MKRVAISTRITFASAYYEPRDSLSHDWEELFSQNDILPLALPNHYENISNILKEFSPELIILSGGDSLGKHEPIELKRRDEQESKILEFSLKNNIPVLAICRGMQLVNQFFGGTAQTLSHLKPKHVSSEHSIKSVSHNSKLLFNESSYLVNSFHENFISKESLGDNLVPLFLDDDNFVEAFYHNNHRVLALMWHPERTFTSKTSKKDLQDNFYTNVETFFQKAFK